MIMIKNITIGIGITLALLSIYFGAYLPYTRAQFYIATQESLPSLTTVDGIESAFNKVFNYRSPIGQEEVVKFFVELVQGAVASGKAPEAVQQKLASFAEGNIDQSDVVQLVQIANTYDMMWRAFQKQDYFDKAESYYLKALAIGPNLPQALYGLFDLYGTARDTAKLEAIGKRIIVLWPNDTRVRGILDAIAKSK